MDVFLIALARHYGSEGTPNHLSLRIDGPSLDAVESGETQN
jgi:hypothetical protein